jgi:hypothetical protein
MKKNDTIEQTQNNENVENTQDTQNVKEAPITPLAYKNVFENLFIQTKSLGQVVFIDNNSELSNTISIIRMLSNGQKQFFKLTLEETNEITIKK